MDFSADGSTLLLADGSDTLFSVDISTGLMTPAGDTGVNVSAMSFRVPAPGSLALLAMGGLLTRRRR